MKEKCFTFYLPPRVWRGQLGQQTQINQLFTLCCCTTKIFHLVIYGGCISVEFKAVTWPVQLFCTNYITGDSEIFFGYYLV